MHVVILADPWLRARHPHALRYSLCCAIWLEPKWLESKWLEPKWLEPKWLEPKSETVGSRCATEPTTTIFEKTGLYPKQAFMAAGVAKRTVNNNRNINYETSLIENQYFKLLFLFGSLFFVFVLRLFVALLLFFFVLFFVVW